MQRFNTHHLFVLVTTALAIGASVVTLLFAPRVIPSQPIDLAAVPQMGNSAPVEMVLFEDLRCSECRDFHLTVLSRIKKQYIETGKGCAALLLFSPSWTTLFLLLLQVLQFIRKTQSSFSHLLGDLSEGMGKEFEGIDRTASSGKSGCSPSKSCQSQ